MRLKPSLPVRTLAQVGLEWIERFVEQFDTSQLGWIRIDEGVAFANRGRADGFCLYPSSSSPLYRIACYVSFRTVDSFAATNRRPSIYVDYELAVGDVQAAQQQAEAKLQSNETLGSLLFDHTERQAWFEVFGRTVMSTWDELVVWAVGHECWRWLQHSGQLRGQTGETAADAFADWLIARFWRCESPEAVAAAAKNGAHLAPSNLACQPSEQAGIASSDVVA